MLEKTQFVKLLALDNVLPFYSLHLKIAHLYVEIVVVFKAG